MSLPTVANYSITQRELLPQNRLSWRLEVSRAALLIHDLQDYFLDPFDRNASPCEPMLTNIGRLVRLCERVHVPLFFSAQPGEQSREERGLLWDLWGPGIIRRPDRQGIVSGLYPRPSATLIEKKRYSAFFQTELRSALADAGRDQLLIGGVYAHIGCLATAVDAFMQGVQPFAVADAMADFCLDDHCIALRQVARTSGVVLGTAEALEALALSAVEQALQQAWPDMPNGLQPGEDLYDAGLDSIRVLSAIELLFRPDELSFEQLEGARTLTAWAELLCSAAEQARFAEAS